MAKTGRKPLGETAKIAYSTKLPEEQVAFLRTLPNAAAWLSSAITAYVEEEATGKSAERKSFFSKWERVIKTS